MDHSINWELCCLCQQDNNDLLQTPKDERLVNIERDLNEFKEISAVPSGVAVSLDQLNDGSGVAATLRSNTTKYHKTCRSYRNCSRFLCSVHPRKSDQLGYHVENVVMSNDALSVIEMTTRAIYARWQLTKLQNLTIIFGYWVN